MSSGFSIRLSKDEITPDLRKKLRAVSDPTPIWRAVGTQVVSMTKRAFRDPSLRISTWQPRSDGSARTLIRKGVLMSSIRITAVSKTGVSVGSDRKYAAIHQLGGVIRAKPGKPLVFTIGGKTIFAKSVTIPASPFFPFLADGRLTPKGQSIVLQIMQSAADKTLGVK